MREELEEVAEVFMQPPQSCEFNVIESCWSKAKQAFRRELQQDPLKHQSEDEFKESVERVTEQVGNAHSRALLRNNSKYIEHYLQLALDMGIREV